MIRWNIREVNETRNDLSRNTNYAKKRQRRTTRLTRIRKGGIISRETRYTLHGQIESSEGFLSASLRAETHLEGADTYKETWRTTLHVRWIFNRCTSKHTSGLTTSKKILEHCEDWQEGGEEEGGGGGCACIALHRRVWNVSRRPDRASLNGRKMIPGPWAGINRLKQWSKRDINHWKISGIYSSYELRQVKERDLGIFFPVNSSNEAIR